MGANFRIRAFLTVIEVAAVGTVTHIVRVKKPKPLSVRALTVVNRMQ